MIWGMGAVRGFSFSFYFSLFRFLNNIKSQPTNIAQAITQGKQKNDIAAVMVIQPIDLNRIAQLGRVSAGRKKFKDGLQAFSLDPLLH